MKHPTPEEWMAYLYEDHSDVPELRRREADAHLAACPECRRQVAEWRATLGVLDEDRIATPERPTPILLPLAATPAARPAARTGASRWGTWLPWALAAGVAVSAAFFTGRAWGPNPAELARELTRMRKELREEIATDLRAAQQRDLTDLAASTVKVAAASQRELATSMVTSFNEARLEDRREFLAVLERMDQRRADDLGQLRESVQTLAERTGGAFRETGSRLNALASALPVREAGDSR